jgi:putative tryptophan/tyrosine transport system substrate-binding protein
MRRRDFITLIGGVATGWPVATRAQQIKIPRIGVLSPGHPEGADASRATLNGLLEGLHDLGYTEGQNITIEREYGDGDPERLRALAAELVKRRVDVIVAFSTTAARPAKQATSIIPIIAIAMADPVEDGLVASLARPGGNVTGTSFLGPELITKRLQLLSEVVPQHSHVTVLWHPHAYSERTMTGMVKETERVAQTLGMQLQFVAAGNPAEIAGAFSTIAGEHTDALCIFPSPMLFAEYGTVANMVSARRLPAIFAAREGVELGGLMSYGTNLPNLSRQTAAYVDKVLKGVKPEELPVQQPTKFELVINLKTAKALDLTITRDFLLIADEVIE